MSKNVNENELELIQNTGEVLKDITDSGTERPWVKHKMENLQLVKLYKQALKRDKHIITTKRLFDLTSCGDTLVFAQDKQGRRKLTSANFCRIRLCPMCQWRRRMKLYSQVNQITNELFNQDNTVRFIFATFTIKNCLASELDRTIDKMNYKFKYITSAKNNFVPTKEFKKNLLGYIKAIEVTYNSQKNTYHPHVHCIFAIKPIYFKKGYIKREHWQKIWQKAMNLDYLPLVDVRAVKGYNSKAIAELAKYPVKTAPILELYDKQAIEVITTLTEQLHKKRFISFGGVFKVIKQQLKLKNVETDIDLIHIANDDIKFNPVCQIMFKYNVHFGCYIN